MLPAGLLPESYRSQQHQAVSNAVAISLGPNLQACVYYHAKLANGLIELIEKIVNDPGTNNSFEMAKLVLEILD